MKTRKKLMLHRETLHSLEPSMLRRAAGAVETGRTECYTRCGSLMSCPSDDTVGCGGDPTIFNTCGACSGGCATGGACTVGC